MARVGRRADTELQLRRELEVSMAATKRRGAQVRRSLVTAARRRGGGVRPIIREYLLAGEE